MRLALVVAAVVWLLGSLALACSIALIPHELDPQEQQIDRTSPERLGATVKQITRGRGPVKSPDGTISMSSCDDTATVVLEFEPEPKDDRTPSDRLGYLLLHVGGELPRTFLRSDTPVRANEQFYLYWIDGATDEQEPLEFAVALVAVDLAGNKSEPSEPIWFRHTGSST
jgi:hypothetical protein